MRDSFVKYMVSRQRTRLGPGWSGGGTHHGNMWKRLISKIFSLDLRQKYFVKSLSFSRFYCACLLKCSNW